MNSAKVENSENKAGIPMDNSKRFFLQGFPSLLIGPGENVLTNLTCVNTVYLLFVFWFVLITSLLYTPLIRDWIERELNSCREIPGGGELSDCDGRVSVESITLRIGFALAGTLLALALLSIHATPGGVRARIHQGFWLYKFVVMLVLLTTNMVIPFGRFDQVWSVISYVGSLVFYCAEIVLILDLATSTSDIFVVKITAERPQLWYIAWLLLIWLIHLTALGFTLILYAVFTNGCAVNIILITAVFLLCTLFSIITVYFSEKRTGFLHSGFATLYVLLLTFITLKHKGFCQNGVTNHSRDLNNMSDEIVKHLEIILGFLLVTYATLRGYEAKYYHACTATVSRGLAARQEDESFENETTDSENENENSTFSSPMFFAMFGVFVLFATSKLTSFRTAQGMEPIVTSTTIFQSRSLTILQILVFLTWSQIFPIVYRNENPFDLQALVKTFLKQLLTITRRGLIEGCGFCNGPVASRYIFAGLYSLGVLSSCMLYFPWIRRSLSGSTYFCSNTSASGVCLSTDPAYMAVYRICVAMATFYLLFAVILICVDSTRDPRVDLQYKAWPVKICLFCSLLLCSFLLPKEFSKVWIYIALVGTFLFTMLQLTLLIYWTNIAAKKINEELADSASWTAALTCATVVMIIISLGAVVAFYVVFAKSPRCATNTAFITLNLILTIAASGVSVHPKSYDAGLFQCYVIVLFALYLTWSGLSHNPDETCNPVAGYIAEVDMRPNLNIQAGVDLFFTFVAVTYFSSKAPEISERVRNAYDSVRNAYCSSQTRERTGETVLEMEVAPRNGTQRIYTSYNFSLFHAVYLLASLHATIILTNWFIPASGSRFKLSANWAAMCIKMTTSNLSLLIYLSIVTVRLLTTSCPAP